MINGIINIYKEQGFTSHDVVAKMRGILRQKKIGHTGTLDPNAEGVLPVCLGSATKLCEMITEKQKEYRAVLLLGKTTDTQDNDGKVIEEKDVLVTKEEVIKVIHEFLGEQEQIPPMYSAIKVNGKKLYELARQGKEIERKARIIEIYEIQVLDISLPRVEFSVLCSKGTYIRTLCYDIGEKLGCGGCMEYLERTKSGTFSIDNAITLTELEQFKEENRLHDYIISIESMFPQCKKVQVKVQYQYLLANGNKLEWEHLEVFSQVFDELELVKVYTSEDDFCAIYEVHQGKGRCKPVKMFL